jgi:rubrerythrin
MNNDNSKLNTYEQILETALKKEKAAYRFYDKHVKNTKVRIFQEIFEELRNEEAQHVKKIQNKLDEIRFG